MFGMSLAVNEIEQVLDSMDFIDDNEDEIMKAMEARAKLSVLDFCPDCRADSEVACPRNVDVACLICGKKSCAHHIGPHLQEVHCVSIEWRGNLKPS